MKHQELKQFHRVLFNEFTFEDFKTLCSQEKYSYTDSYMDEIWKRFNQNRFYFITDHAIGKYIFELVQNKIQMKNILKQI